MARGRGKARGGRSARGAAMAAAEARGRAMDEAVGRWVVLFYSHRALEAFRAGRSQDFRQLRDILNVLLQPLALEQEIHLQLRIVQFLSRLEENWNTDSGAEQMPFESALVFLETMMGTYQLDPEVIENIRRKINEAAVITCIKNQELEKAERLLKTQLSQDPSLQKTGYALQSIIQERNFSHPTVWNFSFKAFQQEILLCLEGYLDDSEPFLLQMARQNLAEMEPPRPSPLGAASEAEVTSEDREAETRQGKTLGRPSEELTKPTKAGQASGTEEKRPEAPVATRLQPPEEEDPVVEPGRATSEHMTAARQTAEPPGVSCRKDPSPALAAPEAVGKSSPKRPAFHSLPAVRQAFQALYNSTDVEAAFSKLDERDWAGPEPTTVPHRVKRQRGEGEGCVAAAAASPGSPPAFLQTSCSVTISHLVQRCEAACACDLCARPEASPKRPGTPVAQPADPGPSTSPCRDSFPRLSKQKVSSWQEEKDTWSDEDELFEQMSSEGESTSTSVRSGAKKQKWTSEETEWIRAGVKKFGEGNWKAIFRAYRFKNRTPVMIKDRWRTMKKLGLN
ncbi:telomeric repeat-binding factor 2 isoform X1 [Paroedura picta]|uniref:telomeric repeat-binding factor 2 isoform X1 n=1 Tax=Paroedura picta TaxID=143630 RepID=UPI00405703AC